MSMYSKENVVQILPLFVQMSICKQQQQLLLQLDVRCRDGVCVVILGGADVICALLMFINGGAAVGVC